MKKLKALLLIFPLLILTACSPVEKQARNAAAALQGSILQAQEHYGASCQNDPSQAICTTINKAISAQNALITAGETYCSWSPTNPPADPKAECVPVKELEPALRAAIANAAQFTSELKGAL